MKFQLLSDLHLEFSPFHIQKHPDSNFLILAGDIGNPLTIIYKKFIKEVSEKYEKVLLIRGNHEIYGMTIEQCDSVIFDICVQYENVFYLQRNSYDIQDTDIRIIGATLWTNIIEEQQKDVKKYMSDFRYIREWSIDRQHQQHEYDVSFIKREVKKAENDHKRLIIITHHAPYLHNVQSPIYEHNNTLFSAFLVDMSFLFESPVIHTWVFGHTHYSSRQHIGNVQLLSNQRGYLDEEFETRFNPLFVFDV